MRCPLEATALSRIGGSIFGRQTKQRTQKTWPPSTMFLRDDHDPL